MNSQSYNLEEVSNPVTRPTKARTQWCYAIITFALAIFFFVSIPYQTTYFEGLPWFKQPQTWPGIAIIGMLLSGVGHLIYLLYYFKEQDIALTIRAELMLLIRAFEISIWFSVYILAVDYLGYLPSSLLFTLFMTYRMGYKQKYFYIYAVLLAIAIVIIFKGFLQVNIPGGESYDYLPQYLQRIAKTYF